MTPLVAFYPNDGALVADHPYVVLDASTGSTTTSAPLPGRFLDFLLAPGQQERFQSLGFRDHLGVPGVEISQDNGLIPSAAVAGS